ncbi:MAG: hypothetical protein ABMA02_12955 [Saprospiraceae bacterium]
MILSERVGDIAESLARLNPALLLELRAPKALSDRVEELVYKKKDGLITPEEALELERYLVIDHLIAMAKARARILLAA